MTDLMLRNSNPVNSLPVFKTFDRFFDSPLFSSPFSLTDSLLSTHVGPMVNIYETNDEYVLQAELPGWKRTEVDISFQNNVLTISGNRQLPQEEGRTWLRVEGLNGQFSRSITIGSGVDASAVTAEMKDGTLSVHMPKREEAKPRRIDIQTVQ